MKSICKVISGKAGLFVLASGLMIALASAEVHSWVAWVAVLVMVTLGVGRFIAHMGD